MGTRGHVQSLKGTSAFLVAHNKPSPRYLFLSPFQPSHAHQPRHPPGPEPPQRLQGHGRWSRTRCGHRSRCACPCWCWWRGLAHAPLKWTHPTATRNKDGKQSATAKAGTSPAFVPLTTKEWIEDSVCVRANICDLGGERGWCHRIPSAGSPGSEEEQRTSKELGTCPVTSRDHPIHPPTPSTSTVQATHLRQQVARTR